MSRRRRPLRLALGGLLIASVAILAGGCGSATRPPAPTPADFPGITRALGPLGISVTDIVSGDAGCDDAHLAPTGISFRASGLDQGTPVPMRVYIFHDDAAFRRNLDAIDACARSYVSDPAQYEKLQASPYVLVGQGPWGERFAAALRQGLETAATAGG
jgi:hypothetical protein